MNPVAQKATAGGLESYASEVHEDAILKDLLALDLNKLQESIFVNRNLRMEKISFIGFDLDWTIADYDRIPLEELTFKLTLERLCSHFGYPSSILRLAEFRPDFSHRGLLIDKLQGAILKMDRHRYVGRAYLGRTEIDTAERTKLYRQERIDLNRDRFYRVDTLFELPEVNLFSEIIEIKIRDKELIPQSYEEIFRDVRQAIDSIHADGTLKSIILAEPERFLARDPAIALTLQKLAEHGRKLVLITNSEWYYTNAICSYLFDQIIPGLTSWRELFDLIVVDAQKPLFFQKMRPFLEIDDAGNEIKSTLIPEWGRTYKNGSRDGIMSLFGTIGEKVLYIGDHIYGDIRWTRVSSTWRTALVIRELADELVAQRSLSRELERLTHLKTELKVLGRQLDLLKDDVSLLDKASLSAEERASTGTPLAQTLEKFKIQHAALRSRVDELQERIMAEFNTTWGSLFKQGASKSLFASQVEDFACLYTADLRNFFNYGNAHYFRVSNDPMAHEADFP